MPVKNKFEAVISGISGHFPGCNSVEEFKEKLFSKSSLLRDDLDEENQGAPKVSSYINGKIPQWNRFDNNCFAMPSRVMNVIDPLHGHILERCFEAIADAGVNPHSLRGRNITVGTAISSSESEILHYKSMNRNLNAYGLIGHNRGVIANRTSYHFGFTGPSVTYDSSFVGALQALEKAVTLVEQGRSEAAVVATCNLIMTTSIDKEYEYNKILATNHGKCCPFDANAQGFCRSEASIAFFIQRAEDAKRNYCSLIKTQVRFLGDRKASYLRINDSLIEFFRGFYKEGEIDPRDISYIEGAGYCLRDTDAVELKAISQVFRKTEPILIGAVSGNIGNAEGTSGFVSLVKVIIAMESGTIPPTINYHTPNPEVEDLVSGKIQPVTEARPVPGDLMAVNCLGLSGSAGHVVVKRSSRPKTETVTETDDLPRLVILQARQDDNIKEIIEKVISMPVNFEYAAMVNSLFQTQVFGYLCRGYTSMSSSVVPYNYRMYDPTKRPVWFVFSGMGSQWPGMGRDLMRIPLFAAAIDRCDRVLGPKGLDIKHILTTYDEKIFDNILNCFVGIAAVQIGLVDILTALGVIPDGMVGHSVGELGCGYADSCLTAEQMILAAYARGKASLECETVPGLMAAVGKGYSVMKDQVPSSLDVACHNSADSCTLSGPTEDVLQYVKQLEDSGVFAKAVSTGAIAYHSRYIKPVAPKLLEYLKQVIPNPKIRSRRWVCSSVPESKWKTRECQMSSAEYHTNNLLSPVLFEEACQHIPEQAIVIEIAPRGLLQAILKRSSLSNCLHLSLTTRSLDGNVNHLLSSVGQLYLHGVEVNVNGLYPAVTYPVSRGTPSLVDLVTWNHSREQYRELSRVIQKMNHTGYCEESQYISVDKDYESLKDHRVGGQVILPLAHMMLIGWRAMRSTSDNDMTLVVNDAIITDNIPIEPSGTMVSFLISIVSTRCELYSENHFKTIMVGSMKDIEEEVIDFTPKVKQLCELSKVTGREFYGHLGRMGCRVGKQWQTIVDVMIGETDCVAHIEWTGNCMIFLENIFKLVIFLKTKETDDLMRISSFKRLVFNGKLISILPVGSEVEVHFDCRLNHLCYIEEWSVSKTAEFLRSSGNKRVLIVGELEDVKDLENTSSIESNVFYLTHKNCNQNVSMMETVLYHESATCRIELLKKPCGEHVAEYWVRGLDADWLVSLRHLMRSHTSGHVVVISNLSPCQLLPVIAREHYVSRLRLIFLMEGSQSIGATYPTFFKQLTLGLSINIRQNSVWYFLSRTRIEVKADNGNFFLTKSEDCNVDVSCIGLNTTVMFPDWTTNVPLKHVDYSGLVGGQPVMGVGQLEPFTNDLKTDLTLRWSVPDGWTMEEAATVPIAYCLANYCLLLLANTQPGEIVLITAASTSVGIALIRVAFHVGAKVIACVDTEDQGKILIGTISEINSKDIIVQGSERLAVGVKKRTNGKGARVIVNSQGGEALRESIAVMGLKCVFIHLGEIKVEHRETIGMYAFFNQTSFRAVTLNTIFTCSDEWKQKLQESVRIEIEEKVVKPMKKEVFPQQNKEEALCLLKTAQLDVKPVLSYQQSILLQPRAIETFEPYHTNVITGSQSDLVVDMVEWLARQGCRQLVVLVGDEGLDWERVDNLRQRYNFRITCTPLARAESVEGAKILLKELKCSGRIQHIICLQMKANNKRLENLELASRGVLPDLDQWVSLLGDDISVCQARAAVGLSVCCVRGEGHLENPALILSYLTTLLRDSKGKGRFVTVNETAVIQTEKLKEKIVTPFPSFALQQLYREGCEVKDVPQFVEQPTRSPRHQYTQYNLLPVFVLPGIQPSNLLSLLSRLMHPAFVCSSPARVGPVDQYAKIMCQEILKIKSRGQFILLGDKWSSAVALEVGYILEDGGHQVQLFLLEGGPSMAQDALTDLCRRNNTVLTTSVIVEVLKLPAEAKEFSKLPGLEEQIREGLICSQLPVDERTMVGRALSSVCSQLTGLQQHRPPDRTLRGDLRVISHRELTASEKAKELIKLPGLEEQISEGLICSQVPVDESTMVGRALSSVCSQLTGLQQYRPLDRTLLGDLRKVNELSKLPRLEEQISEGLICSQVPVDERTMVGRALSSVCSQLTGLQQYRHPDRTLRGDLKVISHRELTASEIIGLNKLSVVPPEIYVTHDKSYQEVLRNSSTASFINENLSFDWSL